ncbi:WG repeat-containing protein [Aquimarina sp. I32.4]|uniref:WG repeat-containing protein n=1 Tax=Aquimarina sp. I32.4 TaxID=2053903 RepID=UPI001304EDDA|nr:WG repeat-containing protein [Aquimarina sp. I32.4]
MEYFISKLEDKGMHTKGELLKETIETFNGLLAIYNMGSSLIPEQINIENEIYDVPFIIDTTKIPSIFSQYQEVYHVQYPQDGHNYLKFLVENETDIFINPNTLGAGIEIELIPKTIYYRDTIDSTPNYKVNFEDQMKWGTSRVVDSINIQCRVTYVSDYDTITISKNNPKIIYKGGEIILKEMKNNYVHIQLSDTIHDLLEIEGVTSKGKIIGKKYQSDSETPLIDAQKKYTELINALKEVREEVYLEQLNNNNEEFRRLSYNKLSKLDFFNPESDNDRYYYKTIYFNGEVDKIKLYIKKSTRESSMNFMSIANTNYGSLIAEHSKDFASYRILTDTGELITKIQSENYPVLSQDFRYYEINGEYFHLNLNKKELDRIITDSIIAFDNDIVAIKKDRDHKGYELFSSEKIKISNYEYSKFKNDYGVLFGFREGYFYIINSNGKEKTKLKRVVDIEFGYERRFQIMNKNDQYGLLDDKGKRIAPMVYHYIGLFSEGLALVQKHNNGNYGFINTSGKVVHPFVYEDAYSFIDGVTAVKYEGTYKLINTEGKVIVDSKSDNLFMPSVNGREYHFDYSKVYYNSKGKLVSE